MVTKLHWRDLIAYALKYGRYSRSMGEAHIENTYEQLANEGLTVANDRAQPITRALLVTWLDNDHYMLVLVKTVDSTVWAVWWLDEKYGLPVWLGWEEAA